MKVFLITRDGVKGRAIVHAENQQQALATLLQCEEYYALNHDTNRSTLAGGGWSDNKIHVVEMDSDVERVIFFDPDNSSFDVTRRA